MILAALHEAATIIITAPDPDAERVRVGAAVAGLIDALHKPA
jgi:hypothetical protein